MSGQALSMPMRLCKGPGGSPAVGGREMSWAYFNLKTVLTLPNYKLIYTLPHAIGMTENI